MKSHLSLLHLIVPIICLLGAATGFAAGLGTPDISASQEITHGHFDTRKFFTGIRLEQGSGLVLEPQVGLGHSMWEREIRSGYDQITHKIDARAGGKIELFNTFSLSATAKLPVYTVESSERRLAGAASSQAGSRRYGYDILNSANTLCWTGEMGFTLGESASVNLFYDKSYFDDYSGVKGLARSEESFGTKFIFRFW